MTPDKVSPCQYCFDGRCYANAAVSPEEYDVDQPKCRDCKTRLTNETN